MCKKWSICKRKGFYPPKSQINVKVFTGPSRPYKCSNFWKCFPCFLIHLWYFFRTLIQKLRTNWRTVEWSRFAIFGQENSVQQKDNLILVQKLPLRVSKRKTVSVTSIWWWWTSYSITLVSSSQIDLEWGLPKDPQFHPYVDWNYWLMGFQIFK